MKINSLQKLIQAYDKSPDIFKTTKYWKYYEKQIINEIQDIDMHELRSGKYPILSTFGFGDFRYFYHPNLNLLKKIALKFIHLILSIDKPIMPYGIKVEDFTEIAIRHCELLANNTNSVPIKNIEVSTFGKPKDIIKVNGHNYTMNFLGYYIRYCFVNKHISFKGDEIIVELGSGSGHQIEILKKTNPNITILCFDLPAQIYLCENYLRQALKDVPITGTDTTLNWNDLSDIQKGGIYFFGNWQIPLLKNYNFDIFWNAASFGEMEPDIVKNYLSFILGKAKWIYLLQARHGKEKKGKVQVSIPITFDDYKKLLSGYELVEEENAWAAHKRMSESGGYFQAIWKKE